MFEKAATLKSNAAKLLHRFTNNEKKSKSKQKSDGAGSSASSTKDEQPPASFEDWARAPRRDSAASSEVDAMEALLRSQDPR